ncbi:MAG: ATP-binding cassette domain-containing protein, partial [Croceibacterium sp.]
MGEPVATADAIVKRFGALTALDGVALAIPAGQITGLVGPDGAGKTTMIRLLAGLMRPDAGKIAILGRPPGNALDELGYMPQRFGLYEDLTVRQNLDLYAELRAL